MGRYIWIIILLVGVWQFIGSLVEKATKKQQDKRVKDLTAQRGRQQMAGQRVTGQRAAGAAPASIAVVGDRASELAARRKAQLDELRRRRTGQSPQPTGGASPSPATLRPTQPPTQPPTHRQTQPQTRPPSRTPVTRQTAPARPVPSQKPARRRPAPRPTARPSKQPESPRRLQPLQRSAGHPLIETHKETVEATGSRTLRLPAVGDVPMDKLLLRRMMLYREILEPPIALREVQSWER